MLQRKRVSKGINAKVLKLGYEVNLALASMRDTDHNMEFHTIHSQNNITAYLSVSPYITLAFHLSCVFTKEIAVSSVLRPQ